ncbi:MAG: hypothetical protein M3276_05515 [Actinomycetota bacterium]|nr:hypothetical protein [Actinomycetota bacterium]
MPDGAARLLDRREALQRDNVRLRGELAGLAAEREVLAAQVRLDGEEIGRLQAEVARLQGQVEQLQGRLEAARREGKRQSAPFSKGEAKPAARRCRPGRKPGQAYGTKAHRRVPDHVDEVVDVPPPSVCDRGGCGGRVWSTGQTTSQ